MKILLEGINNYQVYIQKRDVLHLERTGRTFLTLREAQSVSEASIEKLNSAQFVSYSGKDAYQYFMAQKDIIDYLDYLEMPNSFISSYLDKEDSYLNENMLELFLEREGIKALPYPCIESDSIKLKTYKTDIDDITFSVSRIPQLFFFEKKNGSRHITKESIPSFFYDDCKKLAGVYTFKENFVSVPSEEDGILLMLPYKEEEKINESKSYLKSIFRKRKN